MFIFRKLKCKKGLTLIEMLIVIAVLSLLLGVIAPQIGNIVINAERVVKEINEKDQNWLEEKDEIEVTQPNNPPVVEPIEDITVKEGDSLNFQIIANDKEDDILTFIPVEIPENAVLDNNGIFNWNINDNSAGNYENLVYVKDNDHTIPISFNITVIEKNKPTLSSIDDKKITTDEVFSFTPNANDPDSDELTFTVSGLPEDASFNNLTGKMYWNNPYSGTWNITITATDKIGQSVSEDFKLTVEEAGPSLTEETHNFYTRSDSIPGGSPSVFRSVDINTIKGTQIEYSGDSLYQVLYLSGNKIVVYAGFGIIDPDGNMVVKETHDDPEGLRSFSGTYTTEKDGVYQAVYFGASVDSGYENYFDIEHILGEVTYQEVN